MHQYQDSVVTAEQHQAEPVLLTRLRMRPPPSSNIIVLDQPMVLVWGEHKDRGVSSSTPGVVWHQKRCVQNQAYAVIHILPFAE